MKIKQKSTTTIKNIRKNKAYMEKLDGLEKQIVNGSSVAIC